ncbi:TonB-dependent siderophore receptor [Xanthomonas translucens]|uniref:TonB-dependent siderophore receptor n=1 Tax=Xanthomonas campestris pv. translucens TaxID=343 RepID=UPI001E328896|nr:TonB-dependent receptor [Xanthomonas translucens]
MRIRTAVVDADLGAATTLSVGYDYRKNRSKGVTWGTYPVFYDDASFLEWPRGFSSAADWSYWNTTATAFADLKHPFGNGRMLRALASQRATDGDMALFYVYGFPNRATGETLVPSAYCSRDRGRQNMRDVYASGPFQAWGRAHELVLGMSGSRYSKTSRVNAAEALAPIGDVLQWNGDYPSPQFAANADKVTDIRRKTVPCAGLIYAITPVYSAFVGYTEIFDPQDNRRRDGSFLDPVLGSSREIGLKGRHLDGRLNTTLVLFDTRQDHVAEADVGKTLPDGLTQAYVAVDGTRSRGVELDASGELSEDWSASFGWSHFAREGPDGADLRTALPHRLLRVFSTYRLPGAWSRLSVGGGANWQSASHAAVDGRNGPQRVDQASETLLGAMARYAFNAQAALRACSRWSRSPALPKARRQAFSAASR